MFWNNYESELLPNLHYIPHLACLAIPLALVQYYPHRINCALGVHMLNKIWQYWSGWVCKLMPGDGERQPYLEYFLSWKVLASEPPRILVNLHSSLPHQFGPTSIHFYSHHYGMLLFQCSGPGGSGTCQFPESQPLGFQAEQILLQEVIPVRLGCRQLPVICRSLSDKIQYLLHHVGIMDIEGCT